MKPNSRHFQKGREFVASRKPNAIPPGTAFAWGYAESEWSRSLGLFESALRKLENDDWRDVDGSDITPVARRIGAVLREQLENATRK